VGKRSKSCYHYHITSQPRIAYHCIHSMHWQLTRWVWVNHTISQCSKWGKGANHVTIIRSLHPSRIGYMHSNMSIQRQLTDWVSLNHTISQCSKWGKGANHVTIIRSLHPSRIDYHYVHSNTSIRRQLTGWVWANHTISQCSSEEKEQIMLPLSDHFTRQG